MFQSTRLRGTRQQYLPLTLTPFKFQSTRPRGTRRATWLAEISVMMFQSTRPRGTRPTGTGAPLGFVVSIHASARDATTGTARDRLAVKFQSTRPRGTRPIRIITLYNQHCFNPRVREGRDDDLFVDIITAGVSIHASARDATLTHCFVSSDASFNPRVREGRDVPLCGFPGFIRVSIHASVKDATYVYSKASCLTEVSIHASVKDAT